MKLIRDYAFLGATTLYGVILVLLVIFILLAALASIWVVPIYLAFTVNMWWLAALIPIAVIWCIFVKHLDDNYKDKSDEL